MSGTKYNLLATGPLQQSCPWYIEETITRCLWWHISDAELTTSIIRLCTVFRKYLLADEIFTEIEKQIVCEVHIVVKARKRTIESYPQEGNHKKKAHEGIPQGRKAPAKYVGKAHRRSRQRRRPPEECPQNITFWKLPKDGSRKITWRKEITSGWAL